MIDCNSRTIELFGYDREEMIGDKFQTLPTLRSEDLPMLLELFSKMLKREIVHRIDIQLKKKDGDLIWVNLQASLVEFDENVIVQVIMHDISKRKEAERIMHEAFNKLRQLDQIPKDQ